MCSVSSWKLDEAPECDTPGVFMANPDNCAGCLMCSKGRLLKFRCHWGLYWDATQKYCHFREEVDCNGIPFNMNDKSPVFGKDKYTR